MPLSKAMVNALHASSSCHGCGFLKSRFTVLSSPVETVACRNPPGSDHRVCHRLSSYGSHSTRHHLSSNRNSHAPRHGLYGILICAAQKGPSEGFDENSNIAKGSDVAAIKVAEVSALQNEAWIQGQAMTVSEQNDPLWEQVGTGLRIMYAIGVYGAMALVGQTMCHFIGIDNTGGFNLSPDVVMQGLGYAIPPMMALLFILDDEVVKKSLPARAVRDVEDEELMSFFVGLSLWQVIFVVSMAAVAEEFFFRVAIQGGLAHIFFNNDKMREPIDGIAALTGVFPSLAPFAHALAAILTAALTGSILFITSFPQDPKYVIAPARGSRASLRNLRKNFAAWHERRQLRRIYSPLLDSLLALYIGFEWIQTGNILAPIITHVIYSSVVVGNGVRRIHEQRDKLRHRTLCLREKNLVSPDGSYDEKV